MFSTLQYLDLCTVHSLPRSLNFEGCFFLQLRRQTATSEALTPLPLAPGGISEKLSRVYKSGPELLSVRNRIRSWAQVVLIFSSKHKHVCSMSTELCQFRTVKCSKANK